MKLLQKLTTWQKYQSGKEGIDGYMVLPFSALKNISQALPANEAELLDIKGVGPVKVRKYGSEILRIVAGGEPPIPGGSRSHSDLLAQSQGGAPRDQFSESQEVNQMLDAKIDALGEDVVYVVGDDQDIQDSQEVPEGIDPLTGEILDQAQVESATNTSDKKELSVSEFLSQVNDVLGSYFGSVRVQGEIIGFKRNQNGHAYFEIKDAQGIMRVSVFRNAYELSGVQLADGKEVIVTGRPQHHERYGFSFIGEFVELAGEGDLKKAYDELKAKIIAEGLTAAERKRALPELPKKIGLITSPTGAAIGDFTTNIGQFGYEISFCPATVEGPKAVGELLKAIRVLTQEDVDLLVITRGGGSLESLAPFNNENIIRALAEFPVPVIAGIGHEQDETLSTLVADLGVSTPTAAARAVRTTWDDAVAQIDRYEQLIMGNISQLLEQVRDRIEQTTDHITDFFEGVARQFDVTVGSITAHINRLGDYMQHQAENLKHYKKLFEQHSPERLLALGYSIVRDRSGAVLKSTGRIKKSDTLQIQLADGSVETIVK